VALHKEAFVLARAAFAANPGRFRAVYRRYPPLIEACGVKASVGRITKITVQAAAGHPVGQILVKRSLQNDGSATVFGILEALGTLVSASATPLLN
jgi:hypothetical protein